jgi:hypothetical protein
MRQLISGITEKTAHWIDDSSRQRSALLLLLGGQTLLAGFCFGLINLVAERRTHRASSSREAVEFETTGGRDGGVR